MKCLKIQWVCEEFGKCNRNKSDKQIRRQNENKRGSKVKIERKIEMSLREKIHQVGCCV